MLEKMLDFWPILIIFPAIVAVGSYGFYKHAIKHTDGSDDIQTADEAQKGLMSIAQATKINEIDGIKTDLDAAEADIVTLQADILKRELGWAILLNASVGTGLGYFLVGSDLAGSSIALVKIYAKTAPTGASLIVDINKNDTTIFTTQANRPEIAIDGHADDSETPDITSLLEGDRLSFDVDQVGSTIFGGNPLLITVIFV